MGELGSASFTTLYFIPRSVVMYSPSSANAGSGTVVPAIRQDAPPEMMALLTSRLDTARSGERENDSTPQPSRHDDVTTRNVDAFIFAVI